MFSIGDALLRLGVDTSDLDKGLNGIADKIKQHQKAIGLAAVGMGVAITGALAMAVKSAAQEEAGMIRLKTAVQNAGISYDDVRESLEKWIDVQQQKTAFADDEQRESLATLILQTNDLTKAQDLLTLAMDIAVGTGRDLSSATQLLSYAMAGNWGMITRYIPAIKEAKTEEERWMMLRQMFKGQAEEFGDTMAGQYKLLMNNIGDLKESIGFVLLPVVEKITSAMNSFVQVLKSTPDWVLELGVVLAGLSGTVALVGGGFLLLAPRIIATGAALSGTAVSSMTLSGALTVLAGRLVTVAAAAGALALAVAAAYEGYQVISKIINPPKVNKGEFAYFDYWKVKLSELTEARLDDMRAQNQQLTTNKWELADLKALSEEEKRQIALLIEDANAWDVITQEMKDALSVSEETTSAMAELSAMVDRQSLLTSDLTEALEAYAQSLWESGESALIAADKLGEYVLAQAQLQVAQALSEAAIEDYVNAVLDFGPASEEAMGAAQDMVDQFYDVFAAGQLVTDMLDNLSSAEKEAGDAINDATDELAKQVTESLKAATSKDKAAESVESLTKAEAGLTDELDRNTEARARAVQANEAAYTHMWEALKERTRFLSPEARAETLIPKFLEKLTSGPMTGGQSGYQVFENYVRLWLSQLGGEGEGYGGLIAPGGKFYDMWVEAFRGASWRGSAKLGPIAEAALTELLKGGITPYGFQLGGVVPGPIGQPVPAIVHGGETVVPSGGITVQVFLDGNEVSKYLTTKVVERIGRKAREARVL